MIVQGRCKESDYMSAQFLHLRPRPAFAVVGILLLGLAVWALFDSRSLILLGCLIFLVAICAFYIPFKAKRTFRQYKALSEPIVMEVREDGLFFKRQNGEGLVPWSHIIKWRSSKTLVLLYPADNLFYIVPSHFFDAPEMYNSFLEALRARLGKAT